jgi:hypothetical protein
MREEVSAMEGERDKMVRAVQDRKREQEKQVEVIKAENASLKDIVQQLNLENTRMTEDKTNKDLLMKDLTSKNLELVSNLQNIEANVYPLNADLKLQLGEAQARLAKNEAFLKKITSNYDHLKEIETKYEKSEGNLAKI